MTAENVGGCWPTNEQELLLRAALWRNAEGLAAWQQWKNQVDVECVDYGSMRLLPLLNANLKAQGIDDPLMARFKSVMRHTWYHNQMLFACAATVLQQLQNAGIQTMILKGAALIALHYQEISWRPMNDFDLMVPTSQAARTVELLKSWGWKPDTRGQENEAPVLIDGKSLNSVFAQPFINEREQSFNLHLHLLRQCCAPHDDDIFWEGAVLACVNDVQTLALNPTDQIFHACIDGVQWNSVAPLHWVADVILILRASENIDWNRLVDHARKRRLNLPLGDALHYLSEKMDVPIPAEVIAAIDALPVLRLDRLEYKAGLQRREARSPLLALWLRYREFSRLKNLNAGTLGIISFTDYLRRLWKVRYIWQLPLCAWTKTVRQARRWLHNKAATTSKKRADTHTEAPQ